MEGVGLCGLESRNLRGRGARSFPLLYFVWPLVFCICDMCCYVIMHGDYADLLRRRGVGIVMQLCKSLFWCLIAWSILSSNPITPHPLPCTSSSADDQTARSKLYTNVPS